MALEREYFRPSKEGPRLAHRVEETREVRVEKVFVGWRKPFEQVYSYVVVKQVKDYYPAYEANPLREERDYVTSREPIKRLKIGTYEPIWEGKSEESSRVVVEYDRHGNEIRLPAFMR